MQVGEVILIIGACSSPILAAWNTWQGSRIKMLEIQMSKLCETCEYDYTPKKEKKLAVAS
jgi:hypothetical protein